MPLPSISLLIKKHRRHTPFSVFILPIRRNKKPLPPAPLRPAHLPHPLPKLSWTGPERPLFLGPTWFSGCHWHRKGPIIFSKNVFSWPRFDFGQNCMQIVKNWPIFTVKQNRSCPAAAPARIIKGPASPERGPFGSGLTLFMEGAYWNIRHPSDRHATTKCQKVFRFDSIISNWPTIVLAHNIDINRESVREILVTGLYNHATSYAVCLSSHQSYNILF